MSLRRNVVSLLALFSVWSACPLRAAVVDNFGCTIDVYGPGGKVILSATECPDVVRREMPSTTPGVKNTLSMYEFSVSVPSQQMILMYRLHFQQALKTGADGKQVAAQYLCSSADFEFGEAAVSTACPDSGGDPFGAQSAWQPVEVADGIPTFDDTALTPLNMEITTAAGISGKATVKCQYSSTTR